MKAIILAAGRGQRMGDLTEDCPKVLLDFDGKPFLGHILMNLYHAGINDFIIVIGYKGQLVKDYVSKFIIEEVPDSIKVEFVEQRWPLGTAHAVSLVTNQYDHILITYGDVLMSVEDYERILQKGKEKYELLPLYVGVNFVADPFQGGAVYFDQANHITKIVEKPPKGESLTHWNAAGIFCIKWDYFWNILYHESPTVYDFTHEWVLTEVIAKMLSKYNAEAVEMKAWLHLQDELAYKELSGDSHD